MNLHLYSKSDMNPFTTFEMGCKERQGWGGGLANLIPLDVFLWL